jgi:SPOR domain
MPTMVTFQAGRAALSALLLGLLAACSSELQDWHSAQSADTREAWQRFIEQHPQSELAPEARLRIGQLIERHDWQRADAAATVEAYRGYLAQYPAGRWAEQARIRIEAFSLGSQPRIAPRTAEEAAADPEARGVRALQLAMGAAAPPATAAAPLPEAGTVPPPPEIASPAETAEPAPRVAPAAAASGERAAPGELAQPGEAAQPADGASAAPAATPAPLSESAPAAGYGVQLGAFGNPVSADREWQRLQGRFGSQLAGLSPRIVLASTNAGQLYRLQANAGDEAQARAICNTLKEQSQACVPVVAR